MALTDTAASANENINVFGLKLTNNTGADIALGTLTVYMAGTYSGTPGSVFLVRQDNATPPTDRTDLFSRTLTNGPQTLVYDIATNLPTSVPANDVLYIFGILKLNGSPAAGNVVMNDIVYLTYPTFAGTIEDLQTAGITITIS